MARAEENGDRSGELQFGELDADIPRLYAARFPDVGWHITPGNSSPLSDGASAALIMVSVFFAFIINGDPTVKQFGVGMGVAVAVDATIVRCLLVPAVMTMLGRSNWWFPRWLDRIVPNFSIEGEAWFRERDAAAAADDRPLVAS